MIEKEYDVVVDVLTKHKEKLQDMIDRNLRMFGLNIMDDIRLEHIDQIDECIELWTNRTKRNETRE